MIQQVTPIPGVTVGPPTSITASPFCWKVVEIDPYGFFGADANISAIHGPITDTNNQYFQNF